MQKKQKSDGVVAKINELDQIDEPGEKVHRQIAESTKKN